MKHLIIYTILAITFCGCKSVKVAEKSDALIEPVVLAVDGNDLFQYWELGMDDNSFILSQKNGLSVYKDSLELVVGKQLLNEVVEMEKSNEGPIRIQRTGLPDGAVKNYELSHSREVGEIRKINHLEKEVLNYQASRFSMLSHPTELHAFILANDNLEKLRICFAGGDQPWPPRATTIFDHMGEALKEDWYLLTHLHNHYEPDTADYIGLLAPSMADAQYFKMLRDEFDIETTLITNGFHTLVLRSEHFDKLAAHK